MEKENVVSVEEKVVKTSNEILNEIKEGQTQFDQLDDDQRDILVHDFNEKNAGIAELSSEKPDQAFVDQCKKDFEDYQGEYLNMPYKMADKEKALEWAKWLKNWNETRVVAPANYWIGVLKFDEVISDIIKKLEENPDEGLEFDYGALTYTHNLMMSPLGTGIEYARWMADNQETYNAILEKLSQHIELVDLIKKKIGLLQSRWGLACNGFKMNILLENLEDYKNINLSNI